MSLAGCPDRAGGQDRVRVRKLEAAVAAGKDGMGMSKTDVNQGAAAGKDVDDYRNGLTEIAAHFRTGQVRKYECNAGSAGFLLRAADRLASLQDAHDRALGVLNDCLTEGRGQNILDVAMAVVNQLCRVARELAEAKAEAKADRRVASALAEPSPALLALAGHALAGMAYDWDDDRAVSCAERRARLMLSKLQEGGAE